MSDKKYISPEHAIRDIMGKKPADQNEIIAEQALPVPTYPIDPTTKMPKPYNPNVWGTPPAAVNQNIKPIIQKRDLLKDLKKTTPLGVALDILTPTPAGGGESEGGAFQKEYEKRVNAGEDPKTVSLDMQKYWSPDGYKRPVELPAETPAETTPAISPPKVPAAPEIPTPGVIPIISGAAAAAGAAKSTAIAPATNPNKNAKKPDGKPARAGGFMGGLGVATPGQSASSISGFESPDYLHMAKSRLADLPAKVVKENTADEERKAIENVPRPKSDRNKTMTRNQEIKKKILDENEIKKTIIKDAVKKSKDKNYSVELNPEYKHEKLSDQ